jgi:hypothetical protein
MNTTTLKSNVEANFLKEFNRIVSKIVIPTFSLIGLITNLISFIVFISLIKKQNRRNGTNIKIFHYFLMKAVCDVLYSFIYLFFETFICSSCQIRNTFTFKLMIIWFYYFIQYVLNMVAIGFEIMATIDCAISIKQNQRFRWLQKNISFFLITILIIVFSLFLECFALFAYRVVRFDYIDSFNKSRVYYYIGYTDFARYGTSTYQNLLITESVFRDVISINILLIFNIYILVQLIRNRKRKNNFGMNGQLKNVESRSHCVRSIAEKAETRKMKMIIIFFLLQVTGHYPNFSFQIFQNSSMFMQYFAVIIPLLYLIPNTSPFFLYLFFNSLFKKILIAYIYNVIKVFKFCINKNNNNNRSNRFSTINNTTRRNQKETSFNL